MKLFSLLLCCCLPLKNLSVTSPFGYRVHPITLHYAFHSGVDLKAHHDTVSAVFDGTASIGYNEYLGLFVAVSSGHLICTYGHLSILLIGAGPVTSGQPIAITGATGRVTGEHLHFSINYEGHPLDPLKFLYQFILKSNNHEYKFQTPDRPGRRETQRPNQGRQLDLPAEE
jgi:murein DD-endopeptidase MepM/ murein hydrolase activator NlpD